MVNFSLSQVLCGTYPATLVSFDIPNGILDPTSLESIIPPSVNCSQGVIISGRGPIWLYCYLIHQYHATRWVGTYDPRLGVVVITRHHPQSPLVGSILTMNTI